MKRLFEVLKREQNVRRLLAASLLVVAFVDLGSQAFAASGTEPDGPVTWCLKYHYENSGVDCPHKRDHRIPDTVSYDNMGHSALIEPTEDIRISGIVYRTELPAAPEVHIVSRPLEPPTHPPKQA